MQLNLVPARTGLAWVRQGVRLFLRQPVALGGMFVFFLVVMSLVATVPWVGMGVALAAMPAATLGLMAAAREAAAGRFARPGLLFLALRAAPDCRRDFITLGLLYALGFVLALGASALVDGGRFASGYLGQGSLGTEALGEPAVQAAMLVALTTLSALSLLFWHAPALVYWYRVPPVKSLFFSTVACLRNLGAFSVYTLGWGALFIGVGLGIGLLLALVAVAVMGGSGSATATGLVTLAMVGTALVLAAMFFASLYTTFVACFGEPAEAAAAPTRR